MRKTIFIGGLFILLGGLFGRSLFNHYNQDQRVLGNGETYYFLQEGVYTDKEVMEANIKDIDNKLITNNDNKYYVYLGITKSESVAEKISKLYEDEGYHIYIKEMILTNEEFSNHVDQFDLLVKSTSSIEEVLTIEEVVLANYEEIMAKDK